MQGGVSHQDMEGGRNLEEPNSSSSVFSLSLSYLMAPAPIHTVWFIRDGFIRDAFQRLLDLLEILRDEV